MSDEQIIGLLKEIRDLQKQHVENYKDALTNQRDAIKLYKRVVRRAIFILLILVASMILLYSISH